MLTCLNMCNLIIYLYSKAEAIFVHMGPSLLSVWEVAILGCGQSVNINNSDVGKMKQILQVMTL